MTVDQKIQKVSVFNKVSTACCRHGSKFWPHKMWSLAHGTSLYMNFCSKAVKHQPLQLVCRGLAMRSPMNGSVVSYETVCVYRASPNDPPPIVWCEGDFLLGVRGSFLALMWGGLSGWRSHCIFTTIEKSPGMRGGRKGWILTSHQLWTAQVAGLGGLTGRRGCLV